jgi:hypothetical protein
MLKGQKKGEKSGVNKICPVCGKNFYVFPRSLKVGKGIYCSHKCNSISKIGKGNKKLQTGTLSNCLTCGKEFYVASWWKKKNAGYCSRICYWKSRIGKRPWNYEGKTPINQCIRKSNEYKLWRKAVFERDNYTCVWCGKRGDIEADHIKPFSLYPALRFAIDNGRTLCKDCHRKTDTYGNKLLIKIYNVKH